MIPAHPPQLAKPAPDQIRGTQSGDFDHTRLRVWSSTRRLRRLAEGRRRNTIVSREAAMGAWGAELPTFLNAFNTLLNATSCNP